MTSAVRAEGIVRVAGGVYVALAPIDPADPVAGPPDASAVRRREHAAGRELMRRLLARICGPEVAATPIATRAGGQPFVPARPDLGVSMSHSDDWVAAAVGLGAAVGVDVQLPQPTAPGLLRRCCTPAVREALLRMPGSRRDLEFAWLWTVQEACVKATGAGLAGAPWRIPVELGRRSGDWKGVHWLALREQFTVPVSCAYRPEPAAAS